jgi:hypothetical protein
MPFIADRVFDSGLTTLDTDVTTLHITSAEATTFTAATTTLSLGNKTSLNIGAPSARSPSGRRVTVAAITDGSVTATGTATHYAIVDTANSRLLVTGALSASQAVTSGNTFTLGAFDIGIPNA